MTLGKGEDVPTLQQLFAWETLADVYKCSIVGLCNVTYFMEWVNERNISCHDKGNE